MVWLHNIQSLYNLTLRSIDWKIIDTGLLKQLPGVIKEDLLKCALARGKLKEKIGYFLHPDIKNLDVSECTLTDEELEALFECVDIRVLEMNPPKYKRSLHSSLILESLFSRLHRLAKLNIQRNDGVTNRVIAALANHCPLVRELDVSGCSDLSDEAASSMANFTFLNVLNLSDTLVGDRGLIALAEGKSGLSLRELKLNNCTRVSDSGINTLGKRCARLSILVFCGCPKVSVDCQLALDSLINRDKRVKIVTWTVYF